VFIATIYRAHTYSHLIYLSIKVRGFSSAFTRADVLRLHFGSQNSSKILIMVHKNSGDNFAQKLKIKRPLSNLSLMQNLFFPESF